MGVLLPEQASNYAGKQPRERKEACLGCAIAEGLSTERGVLSAGNYLCRCSDSTSSSID